MTTINRFINRGLWIFGPAALAVLFGFATHSALREDGFYVGHPRTTVVYINQHDDPRLQQLAASIDPRQLRSK
jgi:hypothetical protein